MNRLPEKILVLVFCGIFCPSTLTQTGTLKKNSDSTVSGRITIKGKPAPGVVVGLLLNQQMESNSALKATTDQDGRYRITNVPAGTYQVIPAVVICSF